ncbi:voltage-dependent calcium channel gamma-6 subunit [Suncus etruscus]|uniref:voltage-dependent calcium channel gamma-6 subunit n=1 Tax=Suncus etruscus TaxID=109475 RepID=UPI0021106802|nr:voltage-dependent calcium channel gamma-6 subunit [Suncus etruscus]
MMWNNFFLQEEERRRGAASRRRARGPRSGLSPERERKARWTLLGTAVGVALAVLAVGTDYWVELNPAGDAACATAHLGLWKACTRRPRPAHGPPCGPARLHPDANCTYFKFFTTGENAHIFQRTTKREVNLAAGVLAVLGLVIMALGSLCIIMMLTQGAEFLLRVGAICFGIAGLLLLVALETFRQSVIALLSQAEPEAPELVAEYSWSLGCAAAGALVLLLGGCSFLLLSLPRPWSSPCLGRGRDHGAT